MATTSFLTDQDMQTLEERGKLVDYAPNETILQQDEPGSGKFLYWIRKGLVQIDFSRLYGSDTLAYLGEGEIVGEISVLLGCETSASVVATRNVQVLEVPREVLIELIEADDGFAARFYRTLSHTLARRVRNLNVR